MGQPEMDFAALFAATPSPCLVLTPDLVIAEVNRAYLDATCRTREDLLGRHVFDAFPDNPADPAADGVRNLHASLRRVLATREPDSMALQRYDIPVMGRPGVFEERWWSPINASGPGTRRQRRVDHPPGRGRHRLRQGPRPRRAPRPGPAGVPGRGRA